RAGGRVDGDHAGGAGGVEEVLIWSQRAGIPAVSLFLLSADSLRRCWPADLPRLISAVRHHVWWLADLSATFGWQLRAIGRLELVPSELRTALVDAAAETPGGGGMLVQLALGYGGREEIVEALKRWAARHEDPKAPTLSEGLERLDPADLTPYLYTGDAPAPDLILRATDGADLPGSVLWHCIHSDLCFLDVCWPGFHETDFLRALRTFQARVHDGQP
ncbi:MAG: undecaprenyl diphosphate synthase family protein, partial [Candidatus Dormibacteraeota bacterium]|nr:undecaprenyl diphosphate synthase family protein [Candidatus Dormibacteraeota bacterium]